MRGLLGGWQLAVSPRPICLDLLAAGRTHRCIEFDEILIHLRLLGHFLPRRGPSHCLRWPAPAPL